MYGSCLMLCVLFLFYVFFGAICTCLSFIIIFCDFSCLLCARTCSKIQAIRYVCVVWNGSRRKISICRLVCGRIHLLNTTVRFKIICVFCTKYTSWNVLSLLWIWSVSDLKWSHCKYKIKTNSLHSRYYHLFLL